MGIYFKPIKETTNEQRAKLVDTQIRWQHIALFPSGRGTCSGFLKFVILDTIGEFSRYVVHFMLTNTSKNFVLLRKKICIRSVFNGNTIIYLYDIHNLKIRDNIIYILPVMV